MKIVSDGTNKGTHLYTDSGEEIGRVIEFTINAKALKNTVTGVEDFITVRVVLYKPELDIELLDKNVEWIVKE